MKQDLAILAAVVTLLCAVSALAEWAPPDVPDLTKGGTNFNDHSWTLGPTGARGWIWEWNVETIDARQILVTQVDKGSPADGILDVGDVILGLNGKPFDSDARKAFGRAITEAEKTENKGLLNLIRWRKGTNANVTVKLQVMGSYSDTAPFDCPKSRKILEQGCRYLASHAFVEPDDGDITAPINALALLASGMPEYMDKVKDFAHKLGAPDPDLEHQEGLVSWRWGYTALFLAEYHLATKDDYVLPAIRKYATTIARGQSAVGTWGHGMAENGSLGGYGAMNATTLPCWLSLILARQCGVNEPVVQAAVETSHKFLGFYINKGGLPYGDHPPVWEFHDNNGKDAFAAVPFDLVGDREGTRFFSKMATASYAEKETGHTGNYFSYLWGPLGVRRAGRTAVSAFMKEQQWYYDLARHWDGQITYQGWWDDSYTGWDMTGPFMLAYALPLEKLFITGKGSHPENQLSDTEVKAVIEDGRNVDNWHLDTCYDAKTEQELLASLGSWSPAVRFRAARSLARKQGDVVPRLLDMLRGDKPDAKLGACQALEYMGTNAAPAVGALVKQLEQTNVWVQIRAMYALAGIGTPARKAAPNLLNMAATAAKSDPRDMRRRYLCFSLFTGDTFDDAPAHGLLADSLEGIDRQLLYPAVKQMLLIDDGMSRMQLVSVYKTLSDTELEPLWPDIMVAATNYAPSGEMFRDEIRLASLDLLAKHHFKEGIGASLDYARNQNPWGSEERMGRIMEVLKSYGVAARSTLPELKEILNKSLNEDDEQKRKSGAVKDALTSIEQAKDQPTLRCIEPTR